MRRVGQIAPLALESSRQPTWGDGVPASITFLPLSTKTTFETWLPV
jgi:hypothetical protein